ncbi:hypothetical protein GCM10023322_62610 [Rugosimonospora acidiphila]|uniref:HTH arsR-type domain-containing protein n=1 Tax=Rugosimonospora acidiphila TaxID=556531 RepID=A0ABP9SI21_9ACTN
MDDEKSGTLSPVGPGSTPAAPPDGWPGWFDPSVDLMLTPRRLRGLTHPVRVRLLWLLETDGPATASQLGRRIGASSGVTSYHLRILGELGFVEEDTARGTGRDRWWRPKYRGSGLTLRSPDDPPDPQNIEVAEQYLRIVVQQYHERMLAYVNSLTGRLDELPTLPWTFHENSIELTHEQARSLAEEVAAVVRRYQREPDQREPDQREPDQREPDQREPDQREPDQREPGEGAVRAIFQFQLLPYDAVDGGVRRDGEAPS